MPYKAFCCFYPRKFSRASSFMHDNDGFSSLNKDLFAPARLVSLVPKYNFDVSSGFIMILFLRYLWHKAKARKKTVHDSGTWATVIESKRKFLPIYILYFCQRQHISSLFDSTTKAVLSKKRNLIFVIFDQQEVSFFFFLYLFYFSYRHATQWTSYPHSRVYRCTHKTIEITENNYRAIEDRWDGFDGKLFSFICPIFTLLVIISNLLHNHSSNKTIFNFL